MLNIINSTGYALRKVRLDPFKMNADRMIARARNKAGFIGSLPKAEEGLHDENISYEEMKKLIGEEDAEKLKKLSLEMYNKGAEYARKKGIIIADTKFEFGKIGDKIIVIDEVLTPDSSRFWPADSYEPGKSQPSFDKQYVRDYLSSTGWDKNSNPPNLPNEIIEGTKNKYIEAYEKITGEKFNFK